MQEALGCVKCSYSGPLKTHSCLRAGGAALILDKPAANQSHQAWAARCFSSSLPKLKAWRQGDTEAKTKGMASHRALSNLTRRNEMMRVPKSKESSFMPL